MAAAEQSCDQTQFGELCSSYIPIERLRRVYAAQQQPERCWAASISMIFGFSGHPVAQARIVQDAYGAVVNMPGNYPALLGSLDREWTDDDGNQFTVAIDSIFAPELGGVALSNDDLIKRLKSGLPILYCTAQHAMVLTAIKFLPAAFGPNITEAWVMDPWPGQGLRRLSPLEMVPFPRGGQLRMAATVEVDDS